ncbi:MAG TPA: hypothetical protein VL442_17765 [Mucilaginibacter sp.]|jgi:hypothetical protein|nr:hypothetical protein [Mucilaginibacter sp.]
MRHTLLYLSFLLVIVATGCLKTTQKSDPVPAPSGTFSGQYARYHRHTGIGAWDTVKTNLTVKFSTTDNTYAVTGATTTIHANSYGTFTMASPYIGFADVTYSSTDTSKVAHLVGYYDYSYDGTNLTMYASSSDTLVLGYALKKVTTN